MISMGNHVKFTHFVLLGDLHIFTHLEINYQFHFLLKPFIFCPVYNKTIIRFVCCNIQNNQGLQLQLVTTTLTLITLVITKTSSNICLKWDDHIAEVWFVIMSMITDGTNGWCKVLSPINKTMTKFQKKN